MSDKTQTAPCVADREAAKRNAGAVLCSDLDYSTEQALCQSLNPEHLAMLQGESGISDEVIQARGYRTITNKKELEALGFSRSQCRVPGLLLPLHTTDGGNTLHVYRPDNPRVIENRRKKLPDGTHPNKVIKYEVPKGAGTRVDCPPVCRPMIADPSIPLWITEGQKKADSLASRGLCVIALLGVWNWKGRNKWDGKTVLADFDYVAFDGRDVRIVFDSDVVRKPEVRQALNRLTEHLQRRKAHVSAVYLPAGTNGKVGVDDWLAAGHTVEELEALVEAPRPEPQPASPIVELLNAPPPTMRRPLTLIDGWAYAAAWLPVRVTITEDRNKAGNIVKYNPPVVKTEIRCFIIRDDGVIFGEGGDKPMGDLGVEVILPEIPPASRTWSTAGMQAYRAGERPDPADVFNRVTDVVNRFIDFARSLADQHTMAELIACNILSTWFLPAFNVVGYLWPNGVKGSGKTVLLHVIAEMSYLGQVILAGGSYASLRDLADYGATLAFDDAESLSDPRRSDPDKRALLLAGNRRGAIVTVKEPGPGKTWRTRHIDAFCPRLFSAISLPDDVLASRAIIIPLIRTPDRYRANADPLDYEAWPHDHQQLVDNLWALTLAHLPKLKEHDKAVSDKASLTGRNLDPWRAILAVADWLTEQDTDGHLQRKVKTKAKGGTKREKDITLWERMNALTVSYQNERPDLEMSDLISLTIRALCACARKKIDSQLDISDVNDISDIKKEIPKPDWCFLTAAITERAIEIAKHLELDIDTEDITSRRVGRALGKMRLKKEREKGTGRRMWRATWDELEQWTTTYAISLPEAMSLKDFGFSPTNTIDVRDTLSCNVTNVGNVTNVKESDGADLLEGVI